MKLLKPQYKINKNFISGPKKLEVIRVAEENQFMLKRLKEKESIYNFTQYAKDYEQSQYYKRNHCIFPSIDFCRTQRPKYHLTETNKKNNFSTGRSLKTFHEYDAKDFEGVKNIQSEQRKKALEEKRRKELEEERKKLKKLYQCKSDINGLGKCNIQFFVIKDNFKVKIDGIDKPEKSFELDFDNRESIEEIQKYYTRYKQMIKDFKYDPKTDSLYFSNDDIGINKVKKIFFLFFQECKRLHEAQIEEEEKEEVNAFIEPEEQEEKKKVDETEEKKINESQFHSQFYSHQENEETDIIGMKKDKDYGDDDDLKKQAEEDLKQLKKEEEQRMLNELEDKLKEAEEQRKKEEEDKKNNEENNEENKEEKNEENNEEVNNEENKNEENNEENKEDKNEEKNEEENNENDLEYKEDADIEEDNIKKNMENNNEEESNNLMGGGGVMEDNEEQ